MKTKSEKKLFELLSLVQFVHIKRWTIVYRIVEIMEYIEVVEKSWYDSYKQKYQEYYPLNLNDLNTWSTFEKCYDLIFKVVDDKLICKAVIWNGDPLYGKRKEERFRAELILPDSFIKEIEDYIMAEFNDYLKDQYILHLEEQKKTWIESLRTKILEDEINLFII